MEFIDQSFASDQDLTLPDRTIATLSTTADNNTSNAQPRAISPTPKERILNTLFKRGSKETLTSNSRSSPIIPARSAHQAAGAQTQGYVVPPSRPGLQSSDGSTSSLSTSVSTPVNMPKSILKPGRGPVNGNSTNTPPVNSTTRTISGPLPPVGPAGYTPPPSSSSNNTLNYNNAGYNGNGNSYNSHLPPSAALAGADLARPASPFAMKHSSNESSDGRDNTNSVSSTNRSSRNLSPGADPDYNLTQSNLTLEGLAQRWYAYQAMMRKRYAEDPFYKRWTKSKWILLLSDLMLLGYSCAVFGITIGYMTGRFDLAVVVMEFHSNLIHLACAASVLGITSAIVGLVGILRENRIWLSAYTFLLWPVFALYVSVGYIAFRRATSHLRAHVKDEWIHQYSRDQRLVVQRNLKCCGYQDSAWYAAYDMRCFPMINLPGCQHKYNVYEEKLLSTCWTAALSIVPFQLFVMIAALLCSNHVDGMLRSGRPGLKSFKEEKVE
ncbi:hypothetical protein EDD11_006261 [Mortierella claussenii]|nr:hypothetical protein EDD11_006261 [Mortierella claussenii]